jgi:CPA2 family monovalent cation:H+ antiporter-2
LAALATAYVLLMAISGPLAARYIEPVVKKFTRRARPEPVPA